MTRLSVGDYKLLAVLRQLKVRLERAEVLRDLFERVIVLEALDLVLLHVMLNLNQLFHALERSVVRHPGPVILIRIVISLTQSYFPLMILLFNFGVCH